MFVNTSDDSDLLVESFNNTTENEYKEYDEDQEVKEEIKETPKKTIRFEQKPKENKLIKEVQKQSDNKQPSLEDVPF
jgi:recombination protein RecT